MEPVKKILLCMCITSFYGMSNGVPLKSGSVPEAKYQLGKDIACVQDVQKHCDKVHVENNFAVFICLQDKAQRDVDEISDGCHEVLWQYKLNLTNDIRFDEAIFKMCGSQIVSQVKPCNISMPPDGSLANCLVEHRDQVSDQKCSAFLSKMALIIFEDYRLIKGFYQKCAVDVQKQNCGQISPKEHGGVHSQMDVIDCLEESIDKLSEPCRKEILRVAELQSDDFHLDRPLFYACQEARDIYCHDVRAGDGRVYKCLLSHLSDEHMPSDCALQLKQREKLMQEDIRINKALWSRCQSDFEKYQCEKIGLSERGEGSNLLLCLQDKVANGFDVAEACQAEMRDFSIQIFEDYQVSPVIVLKCDKEIHSFCLEFIGKQDDGGMMGCLMKTAVNKTISDSCYKAVNEVLKETNAGHDYRVDRPLFLACQHIIDVLCAGKNDAMVLGCLMDNAHHSQMPRECASQVFNLQYFLSRDFSLDMDLYQDCNSDAKRLCHTPDFKKTDEQNFPHGVILSCLYRGSLPNVPEDLRVSSKCGDHIRRVMHSRAASVKLMPEIEKECVSSLGKFCLGNFKEGEEIECLQKHYDVLDMQCQAAINEFIQMESQDFDLDKHLVEKCSPMVSKFCQDELRSSDADTVIPCLISHKSDSEMAPHCATALEHWQILEMKDFKFTAALKAKCEADVAEFCSTSKTKFDALQCLSQKMVEESNENTKPQKKVSQQCRKQVKYELMVQSENLVLNEPLYKACHEDLKRLCPSVQTSEGKALECLRMNRKKIQEERCRKALFKEEETESKDLELDYQLMHTCKRMIKKYCTNTHYPQDIFECLRQYVHDVDMDKSCMKLIKQRQEEEAESIVLDPDLVRPCKADIIKFCPALYVKYMTPGKEAPDNGLIFECLTNVVSDKKTGRLSAACENYVRRREAEVVLDKDLNPQLISQCADEIPRLCNDMPENVIECLKEKMDMVKSKGCREEIKRLVVMGMEDIHVDPPLEESCSRDINTFCRNQPRRDGKVVLCLIDVHKAENLHLTPECENFLTRRIQLYQSPGMEIAAFESLSAIMTGVSMSSNRNYIYMFVLVTLTLLFLIGALFGRVTKRIRTEIKNR